MLIKCNGPWGLRNLKNNPQTPIPKAKGNYLISVPKQIYNPGEHGPSRFIYIGGMGTSERASLSKRLGEFIAAAFGFRTYHAGGISFFDKREEHKINPWVLEIWWYVCNDPPCGEVHLFKEFEKDFNGSMPLLNKNVKKRGCQGLQSKTHNINFEIPWRKNC
jgi:hypothetical protein